MRRENNKDMKGVLADKSDSKNSFGSGNRQKKLKH